MRLEFSPYGRETFPSKEQFSWRDPHLNEIPLWGSLIQNKWTELIQLFISVWLDLRSQQNDSNCPRYQSGNLINHTNSYKSSEYSSKRLIINADYEGLNCDINPNPIKYVWNGVRQLQFEFDFWERIISFLTLEFHHRRLFFIGQLKSSNEKELAEKQFCICFLVGTRLVFSSSKLTQQDSDFSHYHHSVRKRRAATRGLHFHFIRKVWMLSEEAFYWNIVLRGMCQIPVLS